MKCTRGQAEKGNTSSNGGSTLIWNQQFNSVTVLTQTQQPVCIFCMKLYR